MSTAAKTFHDEKVRSLAEQYSRAGFQVSVEPDTGLLPFDLGGYRPDLIAVKDKAGVIVEVEPGSARISVERFQALAEEVARHPGWRFLLVTPDDVESESIPASPEEFPSWRQFSECVDHARRLIEAGEYEPALLYLWGIFEGALRKRAVEASIPVERCPVRRLINHMYSLGELSVDHYDRVLAALEARNRLIHGDIAKPDSQVAHARLAEDFARLLAGLLEEWQQSTH
jgi:hypothetical protein